MRNTKFTQWATLVFFVALCGCGGSQPAGTSSSSAPASAATPAPAAAPAPAPPPPVELAAGTVIIVTADQDISTKTSQPGDHFAASIAQAVKVGDQEVIPAGAHVTGIVRDSKQAGHVDGSAEISVAAESVIIDGQNYPIHTSTVVQQGKGRGKRTAIGAGGAAAAGALIGALAGGGKGAAIGAGAGAGAGLAGTSLTGDRDVTIPAETHLRFKLTQPVNIQTK